MCAWCVGSLPQVLLPHSENHLRNIHSGGIVEEMEWHQELVILNCHGSPHPYSLCFSREPWAQFIQFQGVLYGRWGLSLSLGCVKLDGGSSIFGPGIGRNLKKKKKLESFLSKLNLFNNSQIVSSQNTI